MLVLKISLHCVVRLICITCKFKKIEYCVQRIDLLGERMETELSGQYQDSASLCYICSGNVEKFLDAWYSLVAKHCHIYEMITLSVGRKMLLQPLPLLCKI